MADTITSKEYNGTGSQNTFTYTFQSYQKEDVKVEIDGHEQTQGTHYQVDSYTAAGGTINFQVGGAAATYYNGSSTVTASPPSGTKNIRVYRDTDISTGSVGVHEPKATYVAGSSIKSADLNNNAKQALYATFELKDQEVQTTDIADGSITSAKILDGTIAGVDIANDAIDSQHYAADSIDSEHYAPGSVDGTAIANDAIDSQHYAADSIDAEHYAPGSVDGTAIANDAIDSQHYAADSIDTEHYAANSVDTTALAADAVTVDKLANFTTGAQLILSNNSSVPTLVGMTGDVGMNHAGVTTIENLAINSAKLAQNAVTSGKILDDAVTGPKIVADAIDSEHYAAASIDNEHLADDAVGADELAANAVVNASIAANAAIDATKIADGTVTNAEFQYINSVTSNVQTQIDAKQAADAQLTTLAGMQSGTASVLADSTALTSTTAELNLLDGKSIVTTISSPTDVQIPTAQAVDERIVDLVTDVGGFRPIANETSFPATNPDPDDNAGTIVSVKALASNLTSNGSGVATIANGAGSGNTVTINGMANSDTIEAGKGILVETTSTLHTYTFHRETLAPADVTAAQTAVNDFNARYRILASGTNINTVGSLDDGDLLWDSNVDKMKVYDATASAWKEVTSTGEFKFLYLCTSNGSGTPTYGGASYDLREGSASGSVASVTNAAQLLVSINGVIQKANTGTSAPSEGFAMVDGNSIIFGSNIASTDNVFIVQIGSAVSIPTPGDDTVSTIKIQNLAVSTDKIADQAVDLTKLSHGDGTSNGKFLRSNNGADPTWETVATDLAGDSTPQLGGDLDILANKITTSTTNGNILLDPNGTGVVSVDSNLTLADSKQLLIGGSSDLVIDHTGSHSRIVEQGTGDLQISSSSKVEISTSAGNGDVTITPHGTGTINLNNDVAVLNGGNSLGGKITLQEGGANGTATVGIKCPDDKGSDASYTITLPSAAPTSNGQALTATTAGVASWADAGGAALSGSTNNTICTVTGANAIQGESTFTYDGKDLAIGVTGETGWASDATSVQIGGLGAIWGKTTQSAGAGIEVGYNVYDDNSVGNAFIVTDEATKYRQDDGAHHFYTAASGTADAAITWKERLKIGNVSTTEIHRETAVTDTFSDVLDVKGTSTGTTALWASSSASGFTPRIRIFTQKDNGDTWPFGWIGSTFNAGGDADLCLGADSYEHMVIGRRGTVHFTSDGSHAGYTSGTASTTHEIDNARDSADGTAITSSNSGMYQSCLVMQCARSSSDTWEAMRVYSSTSSDQEFELEGDGDGFADGSWSGGGADYAEFFEWEDGNSSNEDRRGMSVTLVGNKIKLASADDTIIGIVSRNPVVVGDAAWNKWTGKHLKDDWGEYILEDHKLIKWTDLDDEGNPKTGDKDHVYTYEDWNIPSDVTVPSHATYHTHDGNGNKFQHRKVNPDWDKDKTYVDREHRKEWETIGLVGKLRLKKGQPTDSRWIKMRDISSAVEEWLVR